MIVQSKARYPNLRVRYINPRGQENRAPTRAECGREDEGPITDEPPAWYCAKPTDGSGPKGSHEGIL